MPVVTEPASSVQGAQPIPINSEKPTIQSIPVQSGYEGIAGSEALAYDLHYCSLVRKKKKSSKVKNLAMLVFADGFLILLVVVFNTLKNQKGSNPNVVVKKEQTANVLGSVPGSNSSDTIEDTLNGEDDRDSMASNQEATQKALAAEKEEPELPVPPEAKSSEIAEMVDQFLKANDFEALKNYDSTKMPEEILLSSFVNKKWPLINCFPEALETYPEERLRLYRYHLNFAVNAAGFPIEASFIVHQRGTSLPKIELDPLFDTIVGALRNYAKSPNKGDTKMYGTHEGDGSIIYFQDSPLKEQQDFYCIINPRQKCYLGKVPNNYKKATMNLRAYTDGEEIALAYCSDKSESFEMIDSMIKGLRWNQSMSVKLSLQWNVKEDPKNPICKSCKLKPSAGIADAAIISQ